MRTLIYAFILMALPAAATKAADGAFTLQRNHSYSGEILTMDGENRPISVDRTLTYVFADSKTVDGKLGARAEEFIKEYVTEEIVTVFDDLRGEEVVRYSPIEKPKANLVHCGSVGMEMMELLMRHEIDKSLMPTNTWNGEDSALIVRNFETVRLIKGKGGQHTCKARANNVGRCPELDIIYAPQVMKVGKKKEQATFFSPRSCEGDIEQCRLANQARACGLADVFNSLRDKNRVLQWGLADKMNHWRGSDFQVLSQGTSSRRGELQFSRELPSRPGRSSAVVR